MFRTAVLATLAVIPIVLPGLAQAQTARPAPTTTQAETAQAGQTPQRIRSVTLATGQTCPKGEGDEIVVCQTLDQPYRIPKALRDDGPIPAQNQSWVNRAASLDEVGRVAGGLPDTCSPVGTGGQSGCAMQRNKAYAAERRANSSNSTSVP
jgi:hypothetical protein